MNKISFQLSAFSSQLKAKGYMLIAIFILFTIHYSLFTGSAFALTISSGCYMPASTSVEVRIYDMTGANLDLDWTNTGVSERASGLTGFSCYYYDWTPSDSTHAYQVDWRDSGTPVAVANEVFYEGDLAMIAVDGSGRVQVGQNDDKAGYSLDASERVKLAAIQPDYAPSKPADMMTLTPAYDAAMTAGSQGSLDTLSTSLDAYYALLNAELTHATYGLSALNTGLLTLQGRLSADRALYLDNLNVPLLAIKARTDLLPDDPASNTAVYTRLAASAYVGAPLAEDIWAYGTRTLTSGGGGATAQQVWEYGSRDLTVSPPTPVQVRAEIDANSTMLAGIKGKTDQMVFVDNKIDANASVTLTPGDLGTIVDAIISAIGDPKELREGNIRKTFVTATQINATRKVGVGRIDYIKIESKADAAADWSAPTNTKYLYFWYAKLGDTNPVKVGENNQ